jgi:hypothetical protein
VSQEERSIIWEVIGWVILSEEFFYLLSLLFILTANGFLPGGSGYTI